MISLLSSNHGKPLDRVGGSTPKSSLFAEISLPMTLAREPRSVLRKLGVVLLCLAVLTAITLALPIPQWRTGRLAVRPLPLEPGDRFAQRPKRIWIDTDAACGASPRTDPDDCFAILALTSDPDPALSSRRVALSCAARYRGGIRLHDRIVNGHSELPREHLDQRGERHHCSSHVRVFRTAYFVLLPPELLESPIAAAAGAVELVAQRILHVVVLMIFLRRVERGGRDDLRDDGPVEAT